MKKSGMRLNFRLFLYNAGLTLFALLVSGALSFILVLNYVTTHEQEQLVVYARSLAEQIAPFMLPELQDNQVKTVLGMYSVLGDFQAKVYDSQWLPVAQSFGTGVQEDALPGKLAPRPPGKVSTALLAVSGDSNVVWHITRRTDASLSTLDIRYICTLPIANSSGGPDLESMITESEGTPTFGVKTFSSDRRSIIAEIDGPDRVIGYIELLHLNDHVTEAMNFFPTAMLLAAVIALALSLVFGTMAGKGMTRSLIELGRQTSLIAAGDLTVRARTSQIPILEARELGEGFNSMAERIKAMIDERDADRRTIRNFLDDVAHEMRTPLSAISNYIELIQGAAAGDEPACTRFLAECGRQIDKLEWLNKNLLDLARLDSGVQTFSKSPQRAMDLLHEAIEVRRSALENKSINLEDTIEQQELIVSCDREWLVIALSNILDNAIKYAPKGSCIYTSARISPDGHEVIFSIADQGPGIQPECLPRIFERFYRASPTGAGCGLGLAMVKSIVDRHCGRVLVDSTPGKGCMFEIMLPTSLNL